MIWKLEELVINFETTVNHYKANQSQGIIWSGVKQNEKLEHPWNYLDYLRNKSKNKNNNTDTQNSLKIRTFSNLHS